MVGILHTYGKNLGDRMSTRGWIRHKDALLDVHSALGRYFVTRFTLDGEEFPDPCSDDFLTVKIWPGRKSADTAITYGGHAARFKDIYKRTGVKVKKVTHAPRYHTAREADEAGLPQEVGGRLGRLGLRVYNIWVGSLRHILRHIFERVVRRLESRLCRHLLRHVSLHGFCCCHCCWWCCVCAGYLPLWWLAPALPDKGLPADSPPASAPADYGKVAARTPLRSVLEAWLDGADAPAHH